MTPLLRAEALKLRTASGARDVLLAGVAASVVLVLLYLAYSDLRPGDERTAIVDAGVGGFFALVFGSVVLTNEFRHGLIVPTLLVTPARRRVLAAKLAVAVAVALAAGALTIGLAVALTLVWFSVDGIDVTLGAGQVAGLVARGTLAFGLWAAIGVGLGAALRDQTGAVVVALAAVLILEPVVATFSTDLSSFGPAAAAAALDGNHDLDNLLSPAAGALVLLGYAVLMAALGSARMTRDVPR